MIGKNPGVSTSESLLKVLRVSASQPNSISVEWKGAQEDRERVTLWMVDTG